MTRDLLLLSLPAHHAEQKKAPAFLPGPFVLLDNLNPPGQATNTWNPAPDTCSLPRPRDHFSPVHGSFRHRLSSVLLLLRQDRRLSVD